MIKKRKNRLKKYLVEVYYTYEGYSGYNLKESNIEEIFALNPNIAIRKAEKLTEKYGYNLYSEILKENDKDFIGEE